MDPQPPVSPVASLVVRVLEGDLRAVARAISLVETGGTDADAIETALHARTGRAFSVGVTGPPGAGKSTLVAQMVGAYRQAGRRVGVLAVDPTSPFTGGALLGDRVRMQEHALDPGVFIRSMATRGHLGGLATATAAAVDVLDAAGFDVILIETVGVGQDEVEVASVADVCLVVSVPGTGDDVQAMKAGVLEIADIHVVNKADREGADRTVAALEQMLALDEADERPRRPVVPVVATAGTGVDTLMAAVGEREADTTRRRERRLRRTESRLVAALSRLAVDRARRDVGSDAAWQALIAAIEDRHDDPNGAAARMLDGLRGVGRLDHIGVATMEIEASLALYGEVLGLSVGPPEDVPAQGVRVRFVETGDTRIELIEPIAPDAPFARSLQTRGPGLHHVAVRVEDLDATLDRLAARGVRLIDRRGRPGAHGTTVAFLHPSSTQGVLIELVEHRHR